MTQRLIHQLFWVPVVGLAATGCATAPPEAARTLEVTQSGESRWYSPTIPAVAAKPATATPALRTPSDPHLTLASAVDPPTPSATSPALSAIRPAYAQLETHPIDLPTVLRLVSPNSPTVGFARARVAEAQARVAQAEVQWLPNLTVGMAYNRFDGQTQNQAGNVFGVSRANLFYGGGPALTLNLADALYGPLIARRVRSAAQFQEVATTISAEQEAAVTYLDLVQLHAQLEINAETLSRAEEMLKAAESAKDAKLDRTAGDVQRARTEVLFRRTERFDLEARASAVSARLGRQLNLLPNVKLVPADSVVAPLTLIDPTRTIDDLLATALETRPDLAAGRETIAAAWERVKQAKREPFIPKVTLQNQTGGFGGGLNDDLSNFSGRNALSVQLFWEVRNLGFGNRAGVAERRAAAEQARYQLADAQARAAAEVVEAAQTAVAKFEAIAPAEEAVKEATELYRINKSGTQNVVGANNLFDALRPLQAIQALNTARLNYLSAVMDHNRAQLRLLAATGTPPTTIGSR